jgi:hypothetical protein
MEKNGLICKICGFESKNFNGMGSHIKQYHHIDTKKYYDIYIRGKEEGKCRECEKESSFYNLRKGYRDHCSRSCSKRKQPNCKGWAHVHKDGYQPWNKGKPMSEDYKKNWLNGVKNTEWESSTPWNKGKKMSDEHRINWENSLRNTKFGKTPDEETRKKLRIIFIEKLKSINKKFHPSYNKKGCEYFNKLMEEKGINIQHAENGGELHIKELGYWVDGYDKENNTVYEWDERYHYVKDELKEKDQIRQKAIEKFLNCNFIRIRESY